MVIVQLNGGLGNQLFQYGAGRAIAHRNRVPLKMDLSILQTSTLRTYRLAYFNVIEEFAKEEEIRRLLTPRRTEVVPRLCNNMRRCFLPYYRHPVLRERSRSFDPKVLKARRNTYLVGYWQSERYFADIADLIRSEFALRHQPDGVNQRVLAEIGQANSVSLHIRRGDYVVNPKTNRVHGVLGMDYYRTAVSFIADRVEQPHFFVFSDDTPWCRQHLKMPFATFFMEHNGEEKDYEDLRLMRNCKHHIIANSSFSWWGAWLSEYPHKLVVAPRKWYAEAEYDPASRFPSDWTVL